jgi:YTH domain-containing family protein
MPSYYSRVNVLISAVLRGPGMRGHGSNGSRKLQLVTDLGGQPKGQPMQGGYGPMSAAPYVPGAGGQGFPQQGQRSGDDRALSAHASTWEQKDRIVGGRASNGNLDYAYNQQGKAGPIPGVPQIPPQYLNQQGQVGAAGSGRLPVGTTFGQASQGQVGGPYQDTSNFITSPIDVPTLIATKGYNPVNFDTKPAFVSCHPLIL